MNTKGRLDIYRVLVHREQKKVFQLLPQMYAEKKGKKKQLDLVDNMQEKHLRVPQKFLRYLGCLMHTTAKFLRMLLQDKENSINFVKKINKREKICLSSVNKPRLLTEFELQL